MADQNKVLGLRINSEIWNKQRFELITQCFTKDFVADYSPRIVRSGHDQVAQMFRSAHATFSGFTETVHDIITNDDCIVLHFTISGVLAVLVWTPYILSRAITWGIPTFLNNYPDEFPKVQPEVPLWAYRSQRAHLNMVETLPAFAAVVIAAGYLAPEAAVPSIAMWAQIFFFARIGHAFVYTLGIPYLRTPVYLVSWAAVLAIGTSIL